jgi:hypothetical protein
VRICPQYVCILALKLDSRGNPYSVRMFVDLLNMNVCCPDIFQNVLSISALLAESLIHYVL